MRSKLFFITALVVLAAGVFFEARLVSTDRQRMKSREAGLARSEQLLLQMRRERDEAVRQIGSQPVSTPPPSPTTPSMVETDPAKVALAQSWLMRVKKLKQLLRADPGQSIPEVELLQDAEWLRLAREAKLETDEQNRRAHAAVRNQASDFFVQEMRTALEKYLAANGGRLPADTLELLRYFPNTLSDYAAMLERYKMVRSGLVTGAPAGIIVEEKAVVDADYDERFNLAVNARSEITWGGTNAQPEALEKAEPDEKMMKHSAEQAVQAFFKANPGAIPSTPAQLIPYFEPPIDPRFLQRLNQPIDAEQLKRFQDEMAHLKAAGK